MRIEINLSVDNGGLPINQFTHAFRKHARARHRRSVDQYRHNWNIARESGLDLNANPIAFPHDPQLAFSVVASPMGTNNGEKNIALIQDAFYVLSKIHADGRRIIVHEYDGLVPIAPGFGLFVMIFETIEDSTGNPASIFTAV